MSGYIGRLPVTEAIQTRKSFTATSGQTTFSMAYQSGFIDVYLNGVKLREGASEDYVASNGTSIVLNSGVVTNTELDVVSLTSASIVDKLPTQSSSTNGKVLTSNGTIASWDTDANTTYSVGDGGLTQINFTSADNTKLDAIEASATADQTNAEIKAAVEAATDSNTFTDADHSKLNAIEASATADQTNAEIKTAYEANSDTNEFSDAEQTKLAAIEASATADQTNAEIKTAYEANADTNEFSDAEQTKLSGIETSADVTDTINVTAAGALMDSELAGLAAVKATTGTFLTADQTKLDGITASANLYVHPSGDGNKHVPADSGSNNGKLLTATSTAGSPTWQDAPVSLPSQSGNANNQLTTDGTNASWTLSSLTNQGLYEHANTISTSYTITTGNNAMSAGPITIGSSGSVTIPSTSTWIVA